jgi:hypothetical protein
MTNLGEVLGWKHNHKSGIATKDGIIIGWPSSLGAMPTQIQIDTWTGEYNSRDKTEEIYEQDIKSQRLFRALAKVCANQFGITGAQMKAAIKAEM